MSILVEIEICLSIGFSIHKRDKSGIQLNCCLLVFVESGYSYEAQPQEQQDGMQHPSEEQNGTVDVKEEEEEVFVPAEVLQIPAGMAVVSPCFFLVIV